MSSWKEISRLRQDRSLVLQILQALFDIEARFPLVLGDFTAALVGQCLKPNTMSFEEMLVAYTRRST